LHATVTYKKPKYIIKGKQNANAKKAGAICGRFSKVVKYPCSSKHKCAERDKTIGSSGA
jgi:hypothetical protein